MPNDSEKPSLLRRKDVSKKTGKGNTSIYEGVKEGTFPRPYKIGKRAVAWLSTDIDKWIAERIAEREKNI